MTYRSYFKRAVWLPPVMLPMLLVLDATYFSPPLTGGLEQVFLIYALGFGIPACLAFACYASRVIDRKSEREVVRLARWAPVIFIPFYGAPWVLYGLGCLMFGRMAGIGMVFIWLAYLPYVLGVGFLLSLTTTAVYKLIAGWARSGG